MGAIMNITADRKADPSSEKASGGRTHRAGAAALLLLALPVLALGLPRLIGATHEAAAQETVKALLSGQVLSPAALDDAAAALAAADRWSPGGDIRLDRGLVLTHRALNALPAEQAAFFAAAEQATVEGLAVSPGEPGGWARLAWLRHRRGDADGAVAALRMSFLSGGFAPPLMQSRLELGLALRPAMDGEMLSLLRRQIRLTWISAPEFIAKLAERPDVGRLASDALAELSEQDVARYLERHGAKQ
jgi:hypothetical protein